MNEEHCSGHGVCETSCSKDVCAYARCKCDQGWYGNKCDKPGNFNGIILILFTHI